MILRLFREFVFISLFITRIKTINYFIYGNFSFQFLCLKYLKKSLSLKMYPFIHRDSFKTTKNVKTAK